MNIDSFSHYLCWRQFQLHFLTPLHLLLRWDYPRSSIINMSDLQSPDFSVHIHLPFGWKYLWISLDGKFLEKNYQNKSHHISAFLLSTQHIQTDSHIPQLPAPPPLILLNDASYLLKADRCQGPLLTLYLPISIHQNILLIWLSISGIHYFLHLFCHYGGWSHYILAILLQGAPNWIYLSYPTYFC